MFVGKIYIHLMWATNDHKRSLIGYRNLLGLYLMEFADKRGINLRILTVLSDHVHCIVKLNSVQSISDIAQILKGASSKWINNHVQLPYKFKWEDDYLAFSFGYSQLPEFKNYIEAQPSYHLNKSLLEELKVLDSKYELKYSFDN